MKDTFLLYAWLVAAVILTLLVCLGISLFQVAFRSNQLVQKGKTELEQYYKSLPKDDPWLVAMQAEGDTGPTTAMMQTVMSLEHRSGPLGFIYLRLAMYPQVALVALAALIVLIGCWLALMLVSAPQLAATISMREGAVHVEWESGLPESK